MRRILLYVLFTFLPVIAQTSVGFHQPENLTPLKEYRLPTWGYNSSELLFDLNGTFRKDRQNYSFYEMSDSRSHSMNFSNSIADRTRYFRESDQYTLTLTPWIRLYTTFSSSKAEETNENKRSKRFSYRTLIQTPFQANYFFHPKHSIMTEGSIKLNYEENQSKQSNDSLTIKRKSVYRNLDYTIKLGYSFGRIRNVTPVVRALRFQERLRALALPSELTAEQSTQLARHIAKHSGYAGFYERSAKYFWDDLAEIINLAPVTPHNAYYLTESQFELIYDRYEGAAFSVGLDLQREYIHSSYKSDDAHLGPFVQFDWYHNFSLRSQLAIHGAASYDVLSTGDTDNYNNRLITDFMAQYHWMIADRTVWENSISYYNLEVESERRFEEWENNVGNRFRISSHLTQRFEDHIYLQAGINFYYYKTKERINTDQERDDKSKGFSYYLRLTYLIDRSMR